MVSSIAGADDTVEMAGIVLSESQATCSVANVNNSFQEDKQSYSNEFDPTPGPSRYALRMNEILVGNFVTDEKQGALSNRVYSKRGDVDETELEGEYRQRGRASP